MSRMTVTIDVMSCISFFTLSPHLINMSGGVMFSSSWSSMDTNSSSSSIAGPLVYLWRKGRFSTHCGLPWWTVSIQTVETTATQLTDFSQHLSHGNQHISAGSFKGSGTAFWQFLPLTSFVFLTSTSIYIPGSFYITSRETLCIPKWTNC